MNVLLEGDKTKYIYHHCLVKEKYYSYSEWQVITREYFSP